MYSLRCRVVVWPCVDKAHFGVPSMDGRKPLKLQAKAGSGRPLSTSDRRQYWSGQAGIQLRVCAAVCADLSVGADYRRARMLMRGCASCLLPICPLLARSVARRPGMFAGPPLATPYGCRWTGASCSEPRGSPLVTVPWSGRTCSQEWVPTMSSTRTIRPATFRNTRSTHS